MRLRALDRLASHDPDSTREELAAQILCGDVRFDAETVRDPKQLVPRESEVTFRQAGFVSRGGIKLEHALSSWQIDVRGKTVLDAGASTGGFTQALLLSGARWVHSVDVGYNQLAYSLRSDRRVICHERTNIQDVTGLDPVPHLAVADLSFRSLEHVASHLLGLVSESCAIMLVKPQFEWRNPPPGFDGRVPDETAESILKNTVELLGSEGVCVVKWLESPIRGRSGNREFFIHAKQCDHTG